MSSLSSDEGSAAGRIAIFTDYLMYFGLRKAQTNLSIIPPVIKIALGATAALKSSGGWISDPLTDFYEVK